MSVQISYNNIVPKKNSINNVFFVDENFNISGLKKQISNEDYSFLSDLIKSKNLKKKILSFDISSKRRVILVSLKKNLKSSDLVNMGAKFYDNFKDSKIKEYILNSEIIPIRYNNVVGHFLHGLKLKSYNFEKYKSKKIIIIYLSL